MTQRGLVRERRLAGVRLRVWTRAAMRSAGSDVLALITVSRVVCSATVKESRSGSRWALVAASVMAWRLAW